MRANALTTGLLGTLLMLAEVVNLPIAAASDRSAIGNYYDDCDRRVDSAEAALEVGDETGLRAAFDSATSCNERYHYIGELLASLLWEQAVALEAANESQKLQITLIEITELAQVWQAHQWLADLHASDKDFAQAAQSYQVAIDIINDESVTEDAPARDVIVTLLAKASEAQLLASSYVPATTRDGAPAGLASAGVRGVVTKKRPLAITFKFDSDEFTEKGQLAALDLVRELKAKQPAGISLIGHTDAIGAAAYNQTLSESRSAAVGKFLEDSGVSSHIVTSGKGESEPAAKFLPNISEAEYRQLCRRVEIRFE